MSIHIEVGFPGGKRVDAGFKKFSVKTDQCKEEGGEGSAPEPFDYFFVSIATCAGIYALAFCEHRRLPTDGLKIQLTAERDERTKLFDPINIGLTLPRSFPDKYRDAIKRTINQCTVKRHIEASLTFNTYIEDDH